MSGDGIRRILRYDALIGQELKERDTDAYTGKTATPFADRCVNCLSIPKGVWKTPYLIREEDPPNTRPPLGGTLHFCSIGCRNEWCTKVAADQGHTVESEVLSSGDVQQVVFRQRRLKDCDASYGCPPHREAITEGFSGNKRSYCKAHRENRGYTHWNQTGGYWATKKEEKVTYYAEVWVPSIGKRLTYRVPESLSETLIPIGTNVRIPLNDDITAGVVQGVKTDLTELEKRYTMKDIIGVIATSPIVPCGKKGCDGDRNIPGPRLDVVRVVGYIEHGVASGQSATFDMHLCPSHLNEFVANHKTRNPSLVATVHGDNLVSVLGRVLGRMSAGFPNCCTAYGCGEAAMSPVRVREEGGVERTVSLCLEHWVELAKDLEISHSNSGVIFLRERVKEEDMDTNAVPYSEPQHAVPYSEPQHQGVQVSPKPSAVQRVREEVSIVKKMAEAQIVTTTARETAKLILSGIKERRGAECPKVIDILNDLLADKDGGDVLANAIVGAAGLFTDLSPEWEAVASGARLNTEVKIMTFVVNNGLAEIFSAIKGLDLQALLNKKPADVAGALGPAIFADNLLKDKAQTAVPVK